MADIIDASNGRDQQSSSGAAPRRSRTWLWWIVGAVATILVGLYVAGWFFTGNRVPNGTTVAGIDIGGMRTEAARDRLETGLADDAAASVRFRHDGETYLLEPAESGLSADVEETLLEAGGGRSWNPVRMVDLLFGSGNDVKLIAAVDSDALAAAIGEISAEVEGEPVEPKVSFTPAGKPQLVEPEVGVEVDEETAAELAADRYLQSQTPIRLPVSTTDPSLTPAEFADARREVIEPAVSAPITLRLPDRSVSLPVRTYAPALTMQPKAGQLEVSIDVDVLEERLGPISKQLAARPRPARVVLRGTTPVVIPDRRGVALEAQEVADAILPVLTKSGEARSAAVGTAIARAEFTTRDARALGIREQVSEFVTYFPYAEYRNINQSRAAELIDGTVIRPGQTFSFNGTVGERTEANGFVKGFIISNGVFAEELGGGVSQVVTTTYNAAFFAGMDDVEHKPHSFYIDRYPLGREATVAWPSVDLKFRNSTPHGVLINAYVVPSSTVSSGEMHVEMYSTKYWDITAGVSERYNFTSHNTRYDSSDRCVDNVGYGGFEVDVYRSFRRAGSDELVRRESDHVVYTPSDTVICSAPPR